MKDEDLQKALKQIRENVEKANEVIKDLAEEIRERKK